jgi:hypothetical protein
MLEAGLGVGETRFMWVLGGCLTPFFFNFSNIISIIIFLRNESWKKT